METGKSEQIFNHIPSGEGGGGFSKSFYMSGIHCSTQSVRQLPSRQKLAKTRGGNSCFRQKIYNKRIYGFTLIAKYGF